MSASTRQDTARATRNAAQVRAASATAAERLAETLRSAGQLLAALNAAVAR